MYASVVSLLQARIQGEGGGRLPIQLLMNSSVDAGETVMYGRRDAIYLLSCHD